MLGREPLSFLHIRTKRLSGSVVRQHHLALQAQTHHRIGVDFEEPRKLRQALLPQTSAHFLATDVGHVLQDPQMERFEEARHRVLRIDHADHLAVAENGHRQLTPTHGVVHNVVGVLRGVVHNLGHATRPHPADNALSKPQVNRLVDGPVVHVLGSVGGLLDPHLAAGVFQVDDAIFQAQLLDAGRRNVPNDVLRRVLTEHAFGEMLHDVQLLGQVSLGTSLLPDQHAEKPNRNAPHHKHKHPPKDGGEGQEIGQQQRHATKVHLKCRLSLPAGHACTGEFCSLQADDSHPCAPSA